MKNLIVIGGAMGVGKTCTCKALNALLPRSVMLDGDWCWYMDPFTVNDETKAMSLHNIACLLNAFLRCSVIDNVVFCWVLDEPAIWEAVLSRLDLRETYVYRFALVCSPEALRGRVERDVARGLRQPDAAARSLARLPKYGGIDAVKIDVTDIDAARAARQIGEILGV